MIEPGADPGIPTSRLVGESVHRGLPTLQVIYLGAITSRKNVGEGVERFWPARGFTSTPVVLTRL